MKQICLQSESGSRKKVYDNRSLIIPSGMFSNGWPPIRNTAGGSHGAPLHERGWRVVSSEFAFKSFQQFR